MTHHNPPTWVPRSRQIGIPDPGQDQSLQDIIPRLSGGAQNWPFPERPKPPVSMRELSALALYHLPGQQGGCQQVCEYLAANFPFYRQNKRWHHTVQNNMANSRYFTKQPKRFNFSEYKISQEYSSTLNVHALFNSLRQHMDKQ